MEPAGEGLPLPPFSPPPGPLTFTFTADASLASDVINFINQRRYGLQDLRIGPAASIVPVGSKLLAPLSTASAGPVPPSYHPFTNPRDEDNRGNQETKPTLVVGVKAPFSFPSTPHPPPPPPLPPSSSSNAYETTSPYQTNDKYKPQLRGVSYEAPLSLNSPVRFPPQIVFPIVLISSHQKFEVKSSPPIDSVNQAYADEESDEETPVRRILNRFGSVFLTP